VTNSNYPSFVEWMDTEHQRKNRRHNNPLSLVWALQHTLYTRKTTGTRLSAWFQFLYVHTLDRWW